MGYGMKGKIAIGLALSVCLGLLVGALLLPSMNRPSHSLSLWNDYVRAAPLVEQSDRIVLAEYLDSTTHEISEVSPVDGVAHRSVTEEYRRFRVSESLKGSAEADEVVYAVWTAGYTEGIGPGEATEFFAYEDGCFGDWARVRAVYAQPAGCTWVSDEIRGCGLDDCR